MLVLPQLKLRCGVIIILLKRTQQLVCGGAARKAVHMPDWLFVCAKIVASNACVLFCGCSCLTATTSVLAS